MKRPNQTDFRDFVCSLFPKATLFDFYSIFAKFYMKEMSRQMANLHPLGQTVVAQKVVWARKTLPWMLKEDWQPPKSTVHMLR